MSPAIDPAQNPKAERRGTVHGSLLIIGGAGGVGSMLIQLARKLTGLTVIATASRPETQKWCRDLGAHHIVNHSLSLADQLRQIGLAEVELIASLIASDTHYPGFVEAHALIESGRSYGKVVLVGF
jgi:NADPH:quinone reductase